MEYEEVIAWDTPEYFHTEKTADWYWILGVVVVVLAALCILFNNILLAIFILLSGLALGLHAHRRPEIIHHELQRRGIVSGRYVYPYVGLDSFWIEEHEHRPEIIIKSKKLLMPYIVIPCGDVPTADIHSYLLGHLPEVEHHEPITYKLFEYLGF